MTEAVTLNQARLHLGIGKEKLRRLLAQKEIEPAQINRQRKEISVEQLGQLQQLLDDEAATSGLKPSLPVKTTDRPDNPASQANQSNSQLNTIDLEGTLERALLKERLEAAQKEVSQLANQLQLTESKLETQLQEAKEERLAERKEREGYQMLMMKFQQDNQQLRQQLLEAPTSPAFSVANSAAERDTPVEFAEAVPQPETVVGMGGISSGRALGVTAFVALIAVIWVTMTNPESPLREAIAGLWQ